MIIYQETVDNFIIDCNNETVVSKILISLNHKRGISGVGQKEKESWKTTLRSVSKILDEMSYKDMQYILLEFVICDSLKRIDLMIAGKDNKGQNNLAITELKGWSKIDLYEDSNLLNPHVSYGLCNHPSSEASDYYYLLKNRYSDIENNFNLIPLAFLPNYNPLNINVLNDKRFDNIVSDAKVYSQDNIFEFKLMLNNNFNSPIDVNDVDTLDNLEYKPSIGFLEHLKNEFKEIRLIGSQNIAFEQFKITMDKIINTNDKTLFVVSGGAGSGKTIVAFKMLNYLLQKSYKVNMIIPGPEFREAIMKNFSQLRTSDFIKGANSRIISDVIIIDEAHKSTGQDNAHVFYDRILKNTKKIVIALIDDYQVINKKGITKDELIDKAIKNNFNIQKLELTEQFRNGGDASYTNWLKKMIYNEKDNHQEKFVNHFFDFKILNGDDFNNLYNDMYDKYNIRMVSFWTQTWNLNELKPTVQIANNKYIWNPNWQWLDKYKNSGNHVYKQLINLCKNKNFNLDKKGKEYIGYFNTIQGYEFEYIFVHIPKLFYLNENNKIDVDLSQLDMSEMSSQIWSVNNSEIQDKESKIKLNKQYFLNRLFVNLTRGTKGCYVYIEDDGLNKFVESKIIKFKI